MSKSVRAKRPVGRGSSHAGLLSMIYAGLIIYGSLFPLTGWRSPVVWLNPITMSLPTHAPRADIIVNILAYVPLGFFFMLWLRPRLGSAPSFLFSVLLGAIISWAMEYLQNAIPSRVTSPVDLYTNCLGSLIGAGLAVLLNPEKLLGAHLLAWRNRRFSPGTLSNLLILSILMWAATELVPFVPSLDWGSLKSGLKPLANTLRYPQSFNFYKLLIYGMNLAGMGFILRLVLREPVYPLLPLLLLSVLLLKVPIVGETLTLEAIAGYAAAMVLVVLVFWESLPGVSLLAAVCVLIAELVSAWLPGSQNVLAPFNWIPFADQVGTLTGMGDLIETLWPFFALAVLCRLNTPWRMRQAVVLIGTLLVALITSIEEWHQLSTPGRFGDITDIILAVLGWVTPWMIKTRSAMPAAGAEPELPQSTPGHMRIPPLAWIGIVMLAVAISGAALWKMSSKIQIETDDRGRTMLPSPQNLPPIFIPGFHTEHPRLPHPTPRELNRLKFEQPQWYDEQRRWANGGLGNLGSIIFMAYAEPGSQDLNLLFDRLMSLKYEYRGQNEAKPIAQAYDWLYPYWSVDQRKALQQKLGEGLEFITHVIRDERLSPYNVYLYNAPLTGLLAANLALYGDTPDGELYMRFTYDLWKNRVLPVWRQIMGKNGGWQEGCEYVGIGIGQAIYTLPNLWRSATGEDLFKSEPGIRGFLDFAVYRIRPDGANLHWGDGAFYDKIIPDLIPLAIEFRNRPAYNLRSPGPRLEPTGWPWGPLTDKSLLSKDANIGLPLSRLFDGVGLLISRSDWSRDATYLAFNAGDNYWSHVHLDQGGFTLYKGGALAIDSGFYGPKYDSDHRMNYSSQSIAHNLVTVTDPDETRISSGKITREIANDGGQRRIGSGWGESAPLDLNEWQEKRETYHTGRMLHVEDRDNLVIAISDVTAAYTNPASGHGEFGSRSRRVERLWRTLVYDRANDVLIVHDKVISTKAAFPKHWLLHTQVVPEIGPDNFEINLPTDPAHNQSGGRLFGKVLLPAHARIDWIGGPGKEFWVDGKNYDENGQMNSFMARVGQDSEPGIGRIVVSPSSQSTHDEFLVVLVPRTDTDHPQPRIEKIIRDNGNGVRISGPVREISITFDSEEPGMMIVTPDNPTGRRIDVNPDPDYDPGWMTKFKDWLSHFGQ